MLAIVLSGGGNRGALQAAALEVLLAEGIVPDLLVGTSVGAINAAYLAAGPTEAHATAMVRFWGQIKGSDIFPGSRAELVVRLLRRQDHLYSAAGLRRILELHLPYQHVEDAAIPLVVVAADLATGAERRINRGPVIEAVLASAAIPGVFPPVTWKGQLLCDGGIVANVPLAAALEAGADEVWILDTSGPCSVPRRPRTAVDIALQAIAAGSAARTLAELSCPPGAAVIHHLVLPCRTNRWFTDFSAAHEMLADGAAATEEYLRAHRVGQGAHGS